LFYRGLELPDEEQPFKAPSSTSKFDWYENKFNIRGLNLLQAAAFYNRPAFVKFILEEYKVLGP
jgi:hypothetical protein